MTFKNLILINPCPSFSQAAEKQLAATTTELASNNPIRLLPIIGVLLAIVLLLVLLAVIIVLVMRNRGSGAHAHASAHARKMRRASSLSNDAGQPPSSAVGSTTTIIGVDSHHHHYHGVGGHAGHAGGHGGKGTHVSFNSSLEDEMVMVGTGSPDVIPQNTSELFLCASI